MKYFSVEEAEALLPRIRPLVAGCVEAKRQADKKVRAWRAKRSQMRVTDKVLLRAQIEFLAKNINEVLEKINKMGCHIKDLEIGLVDFPARINGRELQLCWRLGEMKIRYWHGMREGYRERKPLRRAEKTREGSRGKR